MNLIELQNKIHLQNINKGWWDEHRSFSRITNLNLSEVSESVEAHRKDLMDDKLKSYKGVPVEAADGCIRAFDALSSLKNENFEASDQAIFIIKKNSHDVEYLLSFSSLCFVKAWESYEINGLVEDSKQYLIDAIHSLFEIIIAYGHNPVDLMLEKIDFNETRDDHKKENRQGLVGQKRY